MDSNNQNDDAKSKIEKIRIDLEKKLAALEAVKLRTTEAVRLKKTKITNQESKVSKKIESNRSFIEQIANIENFNSLENFDNKDKVDKKKNEIVNTSKIKKVTREIDNETIFELTDKIEKVKKATPIIVKEEEKKIVSPIIPVSNINAEQATITAKTVIKEESRNTNLNYLIFALATIVVFGIVYLGWNYLNKSSENKAKILLKYENQKYRDSIELADAKSQLSDFISKRYIDSMAIVNKMLLDNDSINGSDNLQDDGFLNDNSNEEIITKKSETNKKSSIKKKTPINNLSNYNSNFKQVTNSKPIITNALPPVNSALIVNKTDAANISDTVNANASKKGIKLDTKIDNKPKKTETLSTIEKSPVYPGCENKSSELAKKKCLMSKVSRFVQKKFNSDLSQDLGLDAGSKKINVQFIIDKNGNTTVLRVRGQHKILEKEALRVVNSLPKMKPGRKNGKSEPVIYNLPIIYNVEY